MAIKLELFSIFIPRTIIDSTYSGGSKALIEERNINNDSYDEHLVRFVAEDSIEIDTVIEEWAERGLRDIRKRKGKRTSIDLCLVDSEVGLTLPCKWLRVENGYAEYII
jgi:hypothetical protein